LVPNIPYSLIVLSVKVVIMMSLWVLMHALNLMMMIPSDDNDSEVEDIDDIVKDREDELMPYVDYDKNDPPMIEGTVLPQSTPRKKMAVKKKLTQKKLQIAAARTTSLNNPSLPSISMFFC
jgi:hypothetical protein